MKRAIVVAVTMLGCFQQPETQNLSCDENNPCPDSSVCEAGHCVPKDSPDLSAQVSDMGTPDGGGLAKGCRNGQGFELGTAYACFGPCVSGACPSLCAPNYSPCTSATGINLTKAATLDGFFLASVPGYYFAPQRTITNCGPQTASGIPVLFGAGKNQTYVTENTVRPCGGFPQSADCGVAPRIVQCSSPWDLSTAAIPSAVNGVLCCP